MLPNSIALPSYEEVMTYLDGFTNYERKTDYTSDDLGLARIRHLLEKLGSPQLQYDVVHIAGTKGKGSTATLTAELLRGMDLRVGLYTSPHLMNIRERIVIDGEAISRERFCEAFMTLRPVLDGMKHTGEWEQPTYFEILTAMAFLAFARADIDVAVLETGLGGRLDATNIVHPVATAITPISIDHTKQLGDTIERIAAEKAGIIKDDVPVIVSRQAAAAMRVISAKAKEHDAPVFAWGADYSSSVTSTPESLAKPQTIDIQTWSGHYPEIRLMMPGVHQAENAGVAAALAETYLEQTDRPPLTTEIIRKAWRKLQIPARIEVIETGPVTVLDGAHNPASMWALSETLRAQTPEGCKRIAVFGASADKDVKGMLRIFLPILTGIIITETGCNRSMPAENVLKLVKSLRPELKTSVELDWLKALRMARDQAGVDGVVCITGSLYLAGNLKTRLLAEAHA